MIDTMDCKPILMIPAVPNEGGIRFLLPSEQIDIDSTISEMVWKIIGLSNGHRNINDIILESQIEKDIVIKIVEDLFSLKIMYDSRELYLHFHENACCPDNYYRNLSNEEILSYTESPRKSVKEGSVYNFKKDDNSSLSKLIFNRRSCRSFSDEKLSKDEIGNICYHGYSISNHVVPSGGGLYPLKIFILVEKEQDGLPIGYYEYDSEKDILIKFSEEVDIEQLKYCFNDEKMPFSSSVQIIVAADLKRQTYKYSNRGYRLTLIEAGQVAQNICLYCAENNISTCELGGFLDIPLMEELELTESQINPLVAIAIGKFSNDEQFDCFDFKNKIENILMNENKVIKNYGVHYFGEGSSFFGAYCNYGTGEDEMSGATSTSYACSIAKAMIEGYERKQSEKIRTDFFGCAKDIKDDWLNPNLIRPLTFEQAKSQKLVEFSDSLPMSWTKGVRANTNKDILVPSNLVYYGNFNMKNRICFSDSSGVAAYTDYDTAIKKAILELVERDAVMRNWYERKSPPKISEKALPIHVRKRIEYWKKHGRNVYVLDMMSIFAPTILVVITGEIFPCFVCGAASTIDDVDTAILKALQEAEYGLFYSLKYPEYKEIEPKDIRMPYEHGMLYNSPKYIQNIEWLWASKDIEDELPIIRGDYNELLKQIDPIIIDLSEKDFELKVIRVLSEKCLPISFGYNMDYFSHPIVKNLEVNSNSRKLPHYFP